MSGDHSGSDNPYIPRLFQRYGPAFRWYATFTVMLGTLSVVLSATIINVAVPVLMRDFHVRQDEVHWLATGFLAAMTVGMLLTAWAVARFGARRAFIGAMAMFIVASLVGGFSQSFLVLVLSRMAQGLAAGLIQPQAMIIIFQVFPIAKRGLGMGIYGMGVTLGPAIAPALGGVLVDGLSWRAVFFIVLPACLVAMGLAARFLPGRDPRKSPPHLDRFGVLLLTSGLFATLWALASGHRRGWDDALVLATLIGGPLVLAAFVRWQYRHRHPLFDLRVFLSPGFAGGFLLAVVMGAGVFASTYLLPLYFQQINGLSASTAGLMLVPAGLSMAFLFPFSGHLTDRIANPLLIATGLVLFAISMQMMRLAEPGTAPWLLVLWAVVCRLGMGFIMPPVTTGSMSLLPPALIAQGSGIINFGRQIGGALGVNISAVFVQFFSDRYWQADPLAGRVRAWEAGFDHAFLLLLVIFLLAFWPLAYLGRGQRRAALSALES